MKGSETSNHVDVLIVGAGLSGIGAACHLQKRCPEKTFAILEGRARMGGTWDLFRYPGIRSDSDMYTLGYSFRPWDGAKAITDGTSIRQYIEDTAAEHRLADKIRYGHMVKRVAWSSADAHWTVDCEHDGQAVRFTASFLFMCAGYYRYEEGYTPDFDGVGDFAGRIVHPQKWTEDIDYTDKNVIVIGSGATAVTLVPSLAEKAAHVTMLQRSPTYVMSLPAEDALAGLLRRTLPARAAYALTRWKNVIVSLAFFQFCRRFPNAARKLIRAGVEMAIGKKVDVDKHFSPHYQPWDQRLCVVPDGDMFRALARGRASVVTDQIDRFTKKGILLRSGQELEADLVVTATGLQLQFLGGAELIVDGKAIVPNDHLSYKGIMLSDVPNMVMAIGYTNASWTLKVDLTFDYATRLLNEMDANRTQIVCPRVHDASVEAEPMLPLASGYVQRAAHLLPRQGSSAPWKLRNNYFLDLLALRYSRLADGTLEMTRAPQADKARTADTIRPTEESTRQAA